MEEVLAKPSFRKRAAIGAVVLLESGPFKLLRHVFFLFPPALLTYAVTDNGIYQELNSWLPKLAPYLQKSAVATLLGCYLYVILMKWIYKCLVDYAQNIDDLDKRALASLLVVLDEVVADKAKRMADFATSCRERPDVCPKNAFQTITQPLTQIAILAKAIRTVFAEIDKTGAFFRVGIMTVKNGRIDDWAAWQPHSDPPDTPLEVLSLSNSSISHAIQTGNIIVPGLYGM